MNSGFWGYLLCLHLLVDSSYCWFGLLLDYISQWKFFIYVSLFFEFLFHYILKTLLFSITYVSQYFSVCYLKFVIVLTYGVCSDLLTFPFCFILCFKRASSDGGQNNSRVFVVSFSIFFSLLTFGHLLVVLVLVSGCRRLHLFPSWWITSGSFPRRLPSHWISAFVWNFLWLHQSVCVFTLSWLL